MSFARASPFPWKVFQGGRPSVARPMLFVKEPLSLPLECCDHQGDGVAEFTAASLFHLYQGVWTRSRLWHWAGKGSGRGEREWEKSTTGVGNMGCIVENLKAIIKLFNKFI